MTPTQRSLALLRSLGYNPWIVERWIQRAGKRIDLFNVIDIIATSERVCLGVQTTGTGFSEHVAKIYDNEDGALKWLLPPANRMLLIGWRKLKEKRGSKRWVYRPRFAVVKRTSTERIEVIEVDTFPDY